MAHGWVNPLPGRMVARCGGPSMCAECAAEQCNRCGLVGAEAMRAHRLNPLEPSAEHDRDWRDGVPV